MDPHPLSKDRSPTAASPRTGTAPAIRGRAGAPAAARPGPVSWLTSLLLLVCTITLGRSARAADPPNPTDLTPASATSTPAPATLDLRPATWAVTLRAARAAASQTTLAPHETKRLLEETDAAFEHHFPMQWDWWHQDEPAGLEDWWSQGTSSTLEQRWIDRALAELEPGPVVSQLLEARQRLLAAGAPGTQPGWLELYEHAARARRTQRLRHLVSTTPHVVFTRHANLGGSHYAYTEGLSDAQAERSFHPGSALCRLDLTVTPPRITPLLEDPNGVIRDPDVSYDAAHILFAWKQADRTDDYHLYEYTVADGTIRQITSGLGFADYEGVYLPNGDLLFNSTRCVQTVDCWWTEVSNLYTCQRDGRFLRRLTYDQVHDNYPTVLPDGRILYTRWEYNDRGQIYVQGLFEMNPDGTNQREFYGNSSWFPTALLHARGIPGTTRVVAVFSGHHSSQAGKLGLLDPARGRQENQGAQLIAPLRGTPAERIDAYGQDGELFQYPYPLTDRQFLVAYHPLGWRRSPTLFKLYWFDLDGRREWLAADPERSCNQPLPLAPRPQPPARPSLVDFRQTTGTYYVQDVYAGPGLAGIPRGSIQRLRVVALEFRAAGLGHNYNQGPAGAALASTPVALGNGSWDVKTVLGDAPVHPDGSACFTVPALTPVYFQALDARGHALQTMRSWSTLQPGETAACSGCHESKNQTPPPYSSRFTLALRAGPQPLRLPDGPPRGFSFRREIQPILDRHCIRCHNLPLDPVTHARPQPLPPPPTTTASPDTTPPSPRAFSLRDLPVVEAVPKRAWSEAYLALLEARPLKVGDPPTLGAEPNELIHWAGAQSVPDLLPAASHGSIRSRFLALLDQGHHDVQLTPAEYEKLACWIDLMVPFSGDYTEANTWTPEEAAFYERFVQKRRSMETLDRLNREALAQPHRPNRR